MGYGLKAVEGAAARGGSDGRDVVGGGCTPLSARATATNNHPWSIHGGFIRQVLLNPCVHLSSRCFPRFSPFFSLSLFFKIAKISTSSWIRESSYGTDVSLIDDRMYCTRIGRKCWNGMRIVNVLDC